MFVCLFVVVFLLFFLLLFFFNQNISKKWENLVLVWKAPLFFRKPCSCVEGSFFFFFFQKSGKTLFLCVRLPCSLFLGNLVLVWKVPFFFFFFFFFYQNMSRKWENLVLVWKAPLFFLFFCFLLPKYVQKVGRPCSCVEGSLVHRKPCSCVEAPPFFFFLFFFFFNQNMSKKWENLVLVWKVPCFFFFVVFFVFF